MKTNPHSRWRFLAALLLCLALALGAMPSPTRGADAARLVADINLALPPEQSSSPQLFTNVGDTMFFVADEGDFRDSIWKTDGTAEGTLRLRSFPRLRQVWHLTAFKGELYFTVGNELWRSDGAESGTQFVYTIAEPNASSFNIRAFRAAGDRLFFVYERPGSHALELWLSDGTAAGTALVTSFPSSQGSNDIALGSPTVVNDQLFFVMQRSGSTGELWISDGTTPGTRSVKSINFSTPGELQVLTVLDGRVYFSANDGAHGHELWASDGTPDGTTLVKDINPAGDARPISLQAFNGRLFFTADDGTSGRELWASDGSDGGTVRLTDTLGDDTYLVASAPLGDKLFLLGTNGVTQSLWSSDGTPAGTALVTQAPFVSRTIIFGRRLVAAGDRLFFIAQSTPPDSQGNVSQLWTSDGTTSGTVPISDVGNPRYLGTVRGRLLFDNDDGVHGRELWTSDGTPQGTAMLKNLLPGGITGPANPAWLTPMQGQLFFVADDGAHGRELWASDGTPAGTRLVKDISPDPANAGPDGLVSAGDLLFFSADDGVHGRELWSSDGTPEGTRMVEDISPGDRGSSPTTPVLFGSRLFFLADDGLHGNELWTSDGTPEGTNLVRDLLPNIFTSRLTDLVVVGDRMFMASWYGELGISDGTPDGTQVLKNTQGTMSFGDLSGARERIFFYAYVPITPFTLWTSDGTAEGTRSLETGNNNPLIVLDDRALIGRGELFHNDGSGASTLLKEINPGQPSSDPHWFALAGSQVLFSAYDSTNGRELWRTDGTPEGTALVKDLAVGIPDGDPHNIRQVQEDGTALFAASDGASGAELWRTDGTAEGTSLVQNIAPGTEGSEPADFVPVGGQVFFTADDGAHGRELWVLPGLGGNNAPVARSLALATAIDGPIEGRLPAGDGDGDQLTYRLVSNGEKGTVEITDPATGAFTYTPGAGVVGSDSFSFSVSDGKSESATATMTVQIEQQDVEPPVYRLLLPVVVP